MKSLLRVALVVALISSCELFDFTQGSLQLSINEVSTRALTPDLNLNPDSFRVSGAGPRGESFLIETSETEILQDSLAQGVWGITVDALNVSGQLIGTGSNSVEVIGNQTATCPVTVVPLEGQGALKLTLDWPGAEVVSPVIEARILSLSGAEQVLPFTITEPGSATCSYNLDNGHYQLFLQLIDGTDAVMGLTESVYIVDGYDTVGAYLFTDVNALTGTIDIDVLIDLIVPVDVVMSGQADMITLGDTLTLGASAPTEVVPITYSWYINGDIAGSGTSFTVGAGLDPGTYRIDVVAVTADQTRAGSVSHTLQIVQ